MQMCAQILLVPKSTSKEQGQIKNSYGRTEGGGGWQINVLLKLFRLFFIIDITP